MNISKIGEQVWVDNMVALPFIELEAFRAAQAAVAKDGSTTTQRTGNKSWWEWVTHLSLYLDKTSPTLLKNVYNWHLVIANQQNTWNALCLNIWDWCFQNLGSFFWSFWKSTRIFCSVFTQFLLSFISVLA